MAATHKAPWVLPIAVGLTAVALLVPDTAHAQRRRRRPQRRDTTQQNTTTTAPDPVTTTPSNDATEPTPSSDTATTSAANNDTTAVATTTTDTVTEPTAPLPQIAALDVSVGGRWYARFFDYHQDLYGALRAYSLSAAPQINVAAQWYPGAHFTRGPGSWFGLSGGAGFVVATSSRDSMDRVYGTTAYDVNVAARLRIPVASHEVGAHVGYAVQRFAIEGNGGAGANDPGVPAVAYQAIQAGIATRLQLAERFAIGLSGSYLAVLNAGEIQGDYFSRASVGGISAELSLAIALVAGFEVRAEGSFRRYFYSMNPEPGDAWVAGGALDHFVTAGLSVAYRR